MLDEASSAKENAFCKSLICPMAANISLPTSLRSSATPSAKGFMGSAALIAAATALATAAAAGAWSRELAEAALDRITDREEGPLDGICDEAYAILLEYRDGLRAAVLQLPGAVREWGYAGRVDGRVESTDMNTHRSNPHPIFSYLGLNIQEMFMTGAAQYPVCLLYTSPRPRD
mgnify:CR=1 FL=1